MTKLYPLDDGIGYVELVDRMKHDTALKVVNSARISYNTKKEEFDNKDAKLTKFLIKHGHTSPFRHTYYTFNIRAPLFVARQWVKYQVGSCWRLFEIEGNEVSGEMFELMFDTDNGCSWNEVSGRYVELKDEFYIPKEFRGNPKHGNLQMSDRILPKQFQEEEFHKSYRQHCLSSFNLYKLLLKNGVAREQARGVLPISIYTSATWTVSLQAVIHFLSQRLKKDSQYEIQCYAKSIWELIKSDLDKLGIDFEELIDN